MKKRIAGLGKREHGRETVKLHMTLFKTSYELNRNLRHIDAREILRKYADYEFGTQEINEIFLAVIGPESSDGFYEILRSAKF